MIEKKKHSYDDQFIYEGIHLYLATEHQESVSGGPETQQEYGGIFIKNVLVTNPLDSEVINTSTECNLVNITDLLWPYNSFYFKKNATDIYDYYNSLSFMKLFNKNDQNELINIAGDLDRIEESYDREFYTDPPDDYDDRDYF